MTTIGPLSKMLFFLDWKGVPLLFVGVRLLLNRFPAPLPRDCVCNHDDRGDRGRSRRVPVIFAGSRFRTVAVRLCSYFWWWGTACDCFLCRCNLSRFSGLLPCKYARVSGDRRDRGRSILMSVLVFCRIVFPCRCRSSVLVFPVTW